MTVLHSQETTNKQTNKTKQQQQQQQTRTKSRQTRRNNQTNIKANKQVMNRNEQGSKQTNQRLSALTRHVVVCREPQSLFAGCLTSQQQASVSQGRICSDNLTCCHTEIEVADPTFYLTQSQYTDTGPTSPSADPITPGAWQGSH